MLTRRHIRIKVMQSIFSVNTISDKPHNDQLLFLKKSFDEVLDLYLVIVSFFKALWNHSDHLININKTQARTVNKNISHHLFINKNPYLFYLSNNSKIKNLLIKKKINHWESKYDLIEKIYQKIIDSNFIEKSLKIKVENNNHKFVVDIFKKIIAREETLHDYFEDININWSNDIPLVNTFLLKQLRGNDFKNNLKIHFPNKNVFKEDVNFGVNLFKTYFNNHNTLEKELIGKTPNWDSKRIAKLDFILIKLAVNELIHFKDIPSKVTLNEYVEIAKSYSTPKSSVFINGVLDRIVKDFELTNSLNKH